MLLINGEIIQLGIEVNASCTSYIRNIVSGQTIFFSTQNEMLVYACFVRQITDLILLFRVLLDQFCLVTCLFGLHYITSVQYKGNVCVCLVRKTITARRSFIGQLNSATLLTEFRLIAKI